MEKQPIYAVVSDDGIVAGPYPNYRMAMSDCYAGEKIIEILPTDQGYEEFKSYMK